MAGAIVSAIGSLASAAFNTPPDDGLTEDDRREITNHNTFRRGKTAADAQKDADFNQYITDKKAAYQATKDKAKQDAMQTQIFEQNNPGPVAAPPTPVAAQPTAPQPAAPPAAAAAAPQPAPQEGDPNADQGQQQASGGFSGMDALNIGLSAASLVGYGASFLGKRKAGASPVLGTPSTKRAAAAAANLDKPLPTLPKSAAQPPSGPAPAYQRPVQTRGQPQGLLPKYAPPVPPRAPPPKYAPPVPPRQPNLISFTTPALKPPAQRNKPLPKAPTSNLNKALPKPPPPPRAPRLNKPLPKPPVPKARRK